MGLNSVLFLPSGTALPLLSLLISIVIDRDIFFAYFLKRSTETRTIKTG